MITIRNLLAGLALALASVTCLATDINKASQAELESIKGIGPAMSSRILDERKKGPFRDWADVMERVKGIKQATATRFSGGGLTVNGGTFALPALSAAPAATPVAAAGATTGLTPAKKP
ncbi:MAG: hypothetical protein RL654_2569 [Pseudomonadota bacterium]|jgi:competence protein ComEA